MAEPKSEGAKPTLVAVDSDPKEAGSPAPAKALPAAPEKQGAGLGAWLLVAVVLAVTIFALVQTQRLQQADAKAETLSDQVIGLEAQLSAANTQISTLEMQRGQVREAVSDLSGRILLLQEIVAE